jgi:hypothetical protein
MKAYQLKSTIAASILLFIIAAGLGLAMRAAFVLEMPTWFEYRNVQHAHSHVALLGWLFAIFYLSIVYTFKLTYKKYITLYWALQATVVGMLITFPIIGYATASIICSTLNIILSYIFAIKVWKDINHIWNGSIAKYFLKARLIFMMMSTIGTWAIGPIMAMGLKGTALYYGAIQFYLHFQFNGWFVFALLAVLFAILKNNNVTIDYKKGVQFFKILLISCVLTFALAITWSTPHISIFAINSIGVIIQLIALILFIRLLKNKILEFKKHISSYTSSVFSIAMVALILKILIQTVVVIPALAEVSYTIRNFVIGFIHLLMLGSLSLFAFGTIAHLIKSKLSILGTSIFVIGVILTELLLFGQGLMLWQGFGFMPNYYFFIAIGSGVILIGLIVIFIHFLRIKIPLT